jgi:hypothetical protein
MLEVGSPFTMTGSPGWLPGTVSTGSRQDPTTDTKVISAANALPVGTNATNARADIARMSNGKPSVVQRADGAIPRSLLDHGNTPTAPSSRGLGRIEPKAAPMHAKHAFDQLFFDSTSRDLHGRTNPTDRP